MLRFVRQSRPAKKNLIIGILVGVILSISLFFIFSQSSSLFVQAKTDTDRLELFSKILSYIKNNYVEKVDDSKLIEGAIRGMLSSIDPHSSYLSPEQNKDLQTEIKGEFGGIGIEIMKKEMLTIIAPIEGTPGYRAGLQPGDIIVKIQGKSTADMDIFDAVKLMRGKPKSLVKITIMRAGFKEPKDFDIMRDIIKVQSVKYQVLEPHYAYIRIAAFQEQTSKQLLNALYEIMKKEKELKGLILDLRNNPGGLLPQALEVSDIFLDEGRIVSTVGRDTLKPQHYYANKEGSFVNFPIALLINSGSASASEIVAGALQDHGRAVIMGQRSFGKGSVQSSIELGDGSALKLTIAKFATPNGRFIQEHGIIPDVVIDNVDMEAYKKSIDKASIWREKDMDRHLQGDGESDDGEEAPTESKVEKKDDKQPGVPLADLLEKDFYVYQALRYLKFSMFVASHPSFSRFIGKVAPAAPGASKGSDDKAAVVQP